MKNLLLLPALLSALAACTPTFQTTSGASYIAESKGFIDREIAEIAAVEPDLRFPARIGIARVVNGQLTSIPTAEVDTLTELSAPHRKMGEFVPVSPLIAAMVDSRSGTRGVVSQIRKAAARQHLHYVMIYEIGARSRTKNTPFALADVTIIGGMLLPTRQIDVTGVGQVAFLDVRNGYPYSTTGIITDLTGFGRTFAAHRAEDALRDKAVSEVLTALVPSLEKMLAGLKERAKRRR